MRNSVRETKALIYITIVKPANESESYKYIEYENDEDKLPI